MNEESAIKGYIRKELMRNARGDEPQITDNLIEAGIIDSLGIQKLLAHLEATFRIEVADDELLPENFETVQSIAAFVRSKTGEQESPADTSRSHRQPEVKSAASISESV